MPLIETMYQRAIEIEPAEIPQNAHMHRNTGEATTEKVRAARSVRDREEELPAARTKHH